jgi:hypothetical protein
VDAAKWAPLKRINVRSVMSALVGVRFGKKYVTMKIGIVIAPPTNR